jgi:GrpB-like predicted nucleotidyltransferase (UPF0157 family)
MKFFPAKSYQPLARQIFTSLSGQIKTRLPAAKVEHIGSSAVPGLWSKEDLDIYVGVTRKDFLSAITVLKALGYVEKRRTMRNKSLWPFVGKGHPLDVGLQLVANGSRFEDFLDFRDYLKRNAQLRIAYNRLKLASSELDPTSYRRLKSRFIKDLLAKRKSALRREPSRAPVMGDRRKRPKGNKQP